MSAIKDGGPAFPQPDLSGYGIGPAMRGEGDDEVFAVAGMSLRDWFAGQVEMPRDGISHTWAEALMGEKAPEWGMGDDLACIRWWAAAEARARYLAADAMVEAREAGQ